MDQECKSCGRVNRTSIQLKHVQSAELHFSASYYMYTCIYNNIVRLYTLYLELRVS